MGVLVGMHYPIDLTADLADHTYVQCGTGAVKWGCWGGSSNGRVLRKAAGSTKRADAIAQPDEKANIRCYLVNGVCHQAANRILLPAELTVSGARGYSISHALFGAYGRVGFWPCKSPFQQFKNVSGDLPKCTPRSRTRSSRVTAMPRGDAHKLDHLYIRRELEIYRSAAPMMRRGARTSVEAMEARDLHLALFMNMADFHLGPMLDRKLSSRLKQVRRKTEVARRKPEAAYHAREMNAREFADAIDEITLAFQSEMANAMRRDAYETLFSLGPDERVILADPRIVKRLEHH